MRKHHLQMGAARSQEQEQTGEESGIVEGWMCWVRKPDNWPACLPGNWMILFWVETWSHLMGEWFRHVAVQVKSSASF